MDDLVLAGLAKSAYTDTPKWVFEDVSATLTEIDGKYVIAFRGTKLGNGFESIEDVIRDVDFVPQITKTMGPLHHGFYEGAKNIYNQAKDELAGKEVWPIGHSLGGGMALPFGAMLHLDGLNLGGIVTWGAPRAGFLRLRAVLSDKTVRQYRNGNDPVPNVPPFPFQHCSELIQIGEPDYIQAIKCHFMEHYIASMNAAGVDTPRG